MTYNRTCEGTCHEFQEFWLVFLTTMVCVSYVLSVLRCASRPGSSENARMRIRMMHLSTEENSSCAKLGCRRR